MATLSSLRRPRWQPFPDQRRKSEIGIAHRSLLSMSSSENAGHKAEHIGGANIAIAIVADQPALDDIDLLLRRLVHDARHQARQLDRVLLIFKQLQFQGLLQALV